MSIQGQSSAQIRKTLKAAMSSKARSGGPVSTGKGSAARSRSAARQWAAIQALGQGRASGRAWSAAVAEAVTTVTERVGSASGEGIDGPQGWGPRSGMGMPQGQVPSADMGQSIRTDSVGMRSSAAVAPMATRRAKRIRRKRSINPVLQLTASPGEDKTRF